MSSSRFPRLLIGLLFDEFSPFAATIGILGYGNIDAALQVKVERGCSAGREIDGSHIHTLHVVDGQFTGSVLSVAEGQLTSRFSYVETLEDGCTGDARNILVLNNLDGYRVGIERRDGQCCRVKRICPEGATTVTRSPGWPYIYRIFWSVTM